jgi:putative phage-type endonuclease
VLTDEQQKLRATGVGGSEVSALLGLNPHRSAIDVWRRKVGEAEPDADNHHTERGRFLEPGLREWASHTLGEYFEPSTTMVHPEHRRVIATPDGVLREGGRVVEVLELKAPGPRTWHEWGTGDDDAPLRYVVQTAQEMLVSGARRGRIGALIDGELRIYTIHRDSDLDKLLVERIEDFWTRYVETRTPPPVDGSQSSREWLTARYPTSTREMVPANRELTELVERLAATEAVYKTAESERELLQQQIKAALGDAYGVEVPGVGKVTYGATKGKTTTDYKGLVESLGVPDETIAQFTRTGKGHRTFRLWPAKGEV